ncbi:hypothetical protein [Streptomyces sp. MST-110588]|uniref:hypothetical protein n=1 Tax=Streptomyces sp. MST-110588 TaxID=2833628 RepID=UPI001F5CC222|nr:hypothetical protein [Streptomyces sp. MST-110588]UNO41071.1 hypothetical protein KGS77_17615 [Streptomyces sp. MST-110588]
MGHSGDSDEAIAVSARGIVDAISKFGQNGRNVALQIALTREVKAQVNQMILPHIPRFCLSGLFLAVGDYADTGERERQYSETFGSLDWLWSGDDELRFRKTDRNLHSAFFSVPEVVCEDSGLCGKWFRVRVVHGGLHATTEQNFGLPATVIRWADPYGKALVCLEEPESRTAEACFRVRFAQDVDLLAADGKLVGWMLSNPAKYLTASWEFPPHTPPDDATASLLSEYLTMVTEIFVERFQDGDEGARQEFREFVKRITDPGGGLPQRQTISRAVQDLADEFG